MLKAIKHDFMAYRNGIVADTLRKAGDPHPIIFGLQLPQIASIASGLPKDAALAKTLWDDRNVRESRLLACRIYPPMELDLEKAMDMIKDIRSREEADILTFYLLRHTGLMSEILDNLSKESEELEVERFVWITDAIKRNLQD